MDRVQSAQRRVRRLGVVRLLAEAPLEGDDGLEVHLSVGAAAAAWRGQPACFCSLDALGAPRAGGRVGGGSPRGRWSDLHYVFSRRARARGLLLCRERVSPKTAPLCSESVASFFL